MSSISSIGGVQIAPTVGREQAAQFRVGQKIEGSVVAVSEDGIATINMNGRTITASSTKTRLSVGEPVLLEITGVRGDMVYASRINSEESAILHRLGFSLSEESVSLVTELLKNNLPIDRETLNQLVKNNSQVRMLLEQLNLGGNIEELDASVKETLIKLFAYAKGAASQSVEALSNSNAEANAAGSAAGAGVAEGTENAGAARGAAAAQTDAAVQGAAPDAAKTADAEGARQSAAEMLQDALSEAIENIANREGARPPRAEGASQAETASQAEAAAQTEGAVQTEGATQTEAAKTPAQSQTETAGAQQAQGAGNTAPADAQRASVRDAALLIMRESVNPGSVPKDQLNAAVKTVLAGFTAKENVEIQANSARLSVKNIAASQLGVTDLADELIDMAKNLVKKDALAQAVKGLSASDNPDRVEGALRALGGKNAEAIYEATKSLSKQVDPQIYYMPVPVRLEGEEARADLYYRRKPQKGTDMSILVALNTHRLGEVRCIINKFPSSYILGFALESEEYSAFLRDNLAELRDRITRIPELRNVEIMVRSRAEVDEEFFPEIDGLSDFDYRV